MNERAYQKKLIGKIRDRFPGCYIMKNDPAELQGVPDLLILFNNRWAMLEVKMNDGSDIQANQEYYVGVFNEMSFASFINPDNEEEILCALQSTFEPRWKTRVSKPK